MTDCVLGVRGCTGVAIEAGVAAGHVIAWAMRKARRVGGWRAVTTEEPPRLLPDSGVAAMSRPFGRRPCGVRRRQVELPSFRRSAVPTVTLR